VVAGAGELLRAGDELLPTHGRLVNDTDPT
jgi:hypothetical protein